MLDKTFNVKVLEITLFINQIIHLPIFFIFKYLLKKNVIIFFLFTVTPLYLFAQSETENLTSTSSNKAFVNALNIYNNAIGRNSLIFTGGVYHDSQRGIKGHPFYMNDYWEIGTIVYEGQKYDSIEIKYDILRDLLLVKNIDKRGFIWPIQLNSLKVEEFNVMGHHFMNIEEDTLSNFKTGFYDVLSDGDKAKVLIKRRKEINESQGFGKLEKEYVLNDIWYIISSQEYYVVKRKSSILKVFADRKNEIKAFLRKNKDKFRNDHEKQLIEVVEYYNSISNNSGS